MQSTRDVLGAGKGKEREKKKKKNTQTREYSLIPTCKDIKKLKRIHFSWLISSNLSCFI